MMYKGEINVSSLKCFKPKIILARNFLFIHFIKNPFQSYIRSLVSSLHIFLCYTPPPPRSSFIILPTVYFETYFPHMQFYAHTITNNYQRVVNSSLDTVNVTVNLPGPFSIMINRSTARGRED